MWTYPLKNNPLSFLKVFAKVYRKDSTVRFLQVELTEQMKEKCSKLKVEETVLFVDVYMDVGKYYSVMMVFLLTSLWEGLDRVAVEA